MLIRSALGAADKRRIQAMLFANNGGDLRQQLLDSAPIYLPLTHTAIPTRGDITPTFTRATTATWKNNDGYLVTGVAGEIGFVGARRVRNLLTFTEDLSNAAWTKINGGAGTAPTITSGFTDPDGGSTAFRIQANAGGSGGGDYSVVRQVAVGGNLRAIYVKSNTGVSQEIYFGAPTPGQKVTATTSWSRVTAPLIGGNSNYDIGSYGTAGNSTTNVDILVWHPQLEDVTAQTTQTAGEYVSVGALDYRSELNRLYLSLPGTAGHYAATPDATANRFTGDQAIVQKLVLPDYTPAAVQMLVSGYVGASGVARKFYLNLQTSGVLRFAWITTAPVDVFVDSTVALATVVANSSPVAIGVSFDVDNGAAGNDIKFWYSLNDGATWTQLGATVTTAGVAVRNAGTAPIQIGAFDGTSQNALGNFYSTEIYNGIPPIFGGSGSATPVVDFNPHRDATTPTGTITSSTTGEVWTINGASSVIRSDYYHGSFVDGVKCFPTDINGVPIPSSTLLGYQAQGARTNLCLQSNAFTTTWTTSGTVTASQNAVGPSGAANEAWTLGDTDAAVLSDFRQELVIANDAVLRGMQVRVGKTVGATTFPGVGVLLLGGTTVAGQWAVNTNLGTLTARSSNAGTVAATIEEAGNFWLIKMSATNNSTGNVTARLQMFPSVNADASATWVASTVGTAVFACAGFEVGWPTSYIATGATAVTRNKDELTYSGGDIPNLKTLSATFKRESGVSSVGVIAALSNGTINEYAAPTMQSATNMRFEGVDGGVLQWATSASNAYAAGATSKVVQSTATNDIKMAKDGVGQSADTTATLPTIDRLDVGHLTGSYQLSGNVGGIYGWTRNLSQSELNAITA